MLEKADHSFDSAITLKDSGEKYYCMSAQCAYYCALQSVMGFLIFRYDFISTEQLYEWFLVEKNKSDSLKGNSHSFYLNRFRLSIKNMVSREVSSKLYQALIELKDLREAAAYKDTSVDVDDINEAIRKAKLFKEDIPNYIKMEQRRKTLNL